MGSVGKWHAGENLVKPTRITTRLLELSSMTIEGNSMQSFLFYGRAIYGIATGEGGSVL